MQGSEEEIEIKSPRGIKLTGVINIPEKETNKLVIISHGLFANKDRYRLIKTSYRFLKAGFATLRYDFSSCGGSESIEYDMQGNVDELRTIISYSRTRGYSKIALLGESFGGLVSLLAYDKNISTLVLWGPVTSSRIPSFLKDEKYKKELQEKGYVVYKTDEGDHKVPQKYVDDRNSIDRDVLLSKIECPVLIIHGSYDNQISYKLSEEAIDYLPEGSRFILIEKGKHSLDNRIDKTIKKTMIWLKENFN